MELSRRRRAIRPFLFVRAGAPDPMRALIVASAVHFCSAREPRRPLRNSSGRNGLRPPCAAKMASSLSAWLSQHKPRRFESCKRVHPRNRSRMNRTKAGLQRDAVDCVHFHWWRLEIPKRQTRATGLCEASTALRAAHGCITKLAREPWAVRTCLLVSYMPLARKMGNECARRVHTRYH